MIVIEMLKRKEKEMNPKTMIKVMTGCICAAIFLVILFMCFMHEYGYIQGKLECLQIDQEKATMIDPVNNK